MHVIFRKRAIASMLTSPARPHEEFVATAIPPAGESDVVPPALGEKLRSCFQRDSWTPLALLRLLLVFALATICSWLGIVLSHQSEGVATIWLSNGLIFGLLITQPKRRWLAYFIAGLMADTLADMIYGDPFRVAIGVSLANCCEVVVSTLLLTRWFGWPLDLARRKTLIGFLLISVLGATALTSALGASWTLLFFPGPPWLQMFRTWYLGDMLGMALLAPLIIVVQRPAFFSMLEREHLRHTLLVLSASVVCTILVFTHNGDPLIFFMFPAFLLVAFRLGFPGTVVNILLATLLAIGLTIKGHGPLMLIPGEHMLLHRIVIAQILGAVGIFTMFPVAALLEEKEELQLSLAASEARFRNLAHSDELTGLPNRRAFNLELESAWACALTAKEPLALLLIDADQFKQYNDVAGHLGGDDCLRSIAGVTSEIVAAANGIPARIGGEEFAAILPNTSCTRAVEIAEEIRRSTACLALEHPSSPSGVQTVSLGVAAIVPLAGQTSISLVQLADQALYSAKLSGRNQVACADLTTYTGSLNA